MVIFYSYVSLPEGKWLHRIFQRGFHGNWCDASWILSDLIGFMGFEVMLLGFFSDSMDLMDLNLKKKIYLVNHPAV